MEPSFERLLVDLESWSPRRCRAAAEALRALGDPRAVGPLVRAIRAVRRRWMLPARVMVDALRTLSVGHEDILVRAVLDEMASGNTVIRGLAASEPDFGALRGEIRWLLVERGRETVLALFRVLNCTRPMEWMAAEEIMRRMGDAAVAEAALQALLPGDTRTPQAVTMLFWLDDSLLARVSAEWSRKSCEVRESLMALLGARDSWVAALAAEALGKAGDHDASARFRRMLHSPYPGHRVPGAVGLAYLGDPQSVAPLIEGLADGVLRGFVIDALGHLGAAAAAALEPLRALRSRKDARLLRGRCAAAIRRIEAAVASAPAELEAADAPAGTGTELEAGSAPEGFGTELVAGREDGR